MDFIDVTFPAWVMQHQPLDALFSTRERLNRFLVPGCEFMSTPAYIITRTLTKKPKEWDAFRKQRVISKAVYCSSQCIDRFADLIKDGISKEEAQIAKTLLMGYTEVYGLWIANHPEVKPLWTELTKKCCVLA